MCKKDETPKELSDRNSASEFPVIITFSYKH